MNVLLKISACITAAGLLLSAPSARADTLRSVMCAQEFRACLDAGYDPDMCVDNHYYCLYGYYPVAGPAMPVSRPD